MCLEFSENKRQFMTMKFGPEVHKGETVEINSVAAALPPSN
jgi:hypothetical protein